MDVAVSYLPMNLESVAASPIIDGNKEEPVAPPPAKRQRFGEEMNRVAEIVLVLSALGRMRGGETPTELELKLMVEARSKLADVCQEFTPEQIIAKDDVKAVIQDLGLNGKLKDQSLGFQAPKLTISEKLSLGKRKMEEAKKYPTPTGSVSHLSQPNGSVASPSLANKVSVGHQWPNSDVTTANTTGSHLRMDRPQTMLNGASQGTPISSANYYAASWSAQPQSTISFSTAPDKKVPTKSSVRVADPSFRPFMSQTPHVTFPGTNQPMQGMHYGQTSSFGNNHSEIAKIVDKVLQLQIRQYPLWNPPSREYMNRAMTCEMCQVTINEVDTLLICDACEKAYHLKCLQADNMKGVPKSDWHCLRCVQAFNGKPLPPQYGRAISTTTAKMHSMTARLQSSAGKKVGSMDIKVNQQKPTVTTTPRVQNFPGFVSGAATTSQIETFSGNANTTASSAKTSNTGSQGFKESVICGANSPAVVSRTETPNPTAIARINAVINNGLISKPLTPVGTMSSTSSLPVGNQVPVNATSNATPSTPITASLVAQAPTITQNGDSSSTASGTADHSISDADLTTHVHTVSHPEDAKASEDAAPMENVVDEPQAPMENVAECEKPSESTSHSDSLNDKTTSENDQESSKDAKVDSETRQNHPTEYPVTVVSDQDSKIIADPSMPHKNSAYQTEKTASQPLSVSSNYQSQTEKETSNVQESLQNVSGDSQEGKGLYGLDDRH